MRRLNEDELGERTYAVLTAVEAGETFRVTRAGIEVAELRRLRQVSAAGLIRRHQSMVGVDSSEFRRELDGFGSDEI